MRISVAVLEQVRGKRVAQGVRAGAFGDPVRGRLHGALQGRSRAGDGDGPGPSADPGRRG